MGWLAKLLSIDAPEHATLHGAGLSFRSLFPLWAALLAVLVLAAGVVWLYLSERGRVGFARRMILALLRTTGLAFLVFLLLRPVLVVEYAGTQERHPVLVVDNSLSMTQRDKRLSPIDQLRVAIAEDVARPDALVADPALLHNLPGSLATYPDRAHLVRRVLANPRLALLDGLTQKGLVRGYLFGQRLQRAGMNEAEELSLSRFFEDFHADESRTCLADAISELLQAGSRELPSAIVLMTDGLDNASKLTLDGVARDCARLGVPLHIYGVGSSEGGILLLKDIGAPDTLFYEDTVSVPIRWQIRGFNAEDLEITMALGGKVVASHSPSHEEAVQQRAVLTFTPRRQDEQEESLDLVATIRLKGNATVRDELKRPVRLVNRRVKVLYVENSPRWEYKFIQAALLRDRRVEANFFLVNGDPKAMQSGPPFVPGFPARDKLFSYDLLILGDVPARFLGPGHCEMIRDFVREGGGLVLVAGRQHAPAEFVDMPLAEVLPVEVLPLRFQPQPDSRPQLFVPTLTEVGKRSDMLALADGPDENARTWKELPGFAWQFPIAKLRPGAVALLEHPRLRMGDRPMPVMATQNYGKGQVLFLATDETWRWRYNAGDRYFGRFWGQVIYQLGLPHLLGNGRRVQLALDRSEATLGRPGSVYARLFDSDYRPLREPRVPARLEYLDARPGQERSRSILLEALPGQPGEYRALLAHDQPGRFELKVDMPDQASLAFRVGVPPGHELEPAGMAEEALRAAAKISGGYFYREEDLYRLYDQVEPRQAAFTQRQEVLLWNPLALLLFVALVTAEWVVRKFSNLS
jgi:hypothetical protein